MVTKDAFALVLVAKLAAKRRAECAIYRYHALFFSFFWMRQARAASCNSGSPACPRRGAARGPGAPGARAAR